MFKTFKEFLTAKGLTHETFEVKEKDEQLSLLKEYNTDNEQALKTLTNDVNSKVSKEDLEAMKTQLEETHELEVKALNDTNREQGLAISKMLKNMTGSISTSQENEVAKFLSDNEAKIKELKAQGHGFIELVTKAPESMTTGSASLPSPAPALQGTQVAPAGNVNLRGTIVDSLVTTLGTNLASYAYTETVPKDGDYAFVAEKGIKPQIDFKIETRYASPKKVAAHMVLTDESVQDIRGLQSIANNYLRAKHDLKRQSGILFGDGVGENPKGATLYGRTFVPGDMASAVTNPNFMDIVNACVTDIYTTHNYTDEIPYMSNIVMVNPVDFYIQLVSAKDDNGLPLYPQAGLFNRVTIGSVTIIPFEDIPTGKIFVADLSKYKTTNYIPYSVKVGWINDQLITNQFTIVGESRFHAFVEKLDEQAFIYDDLSVIKSAIEA